MPTLFDQLQARLKDQEPASGGGPEQAQIAAALRAKSGRARGGAGPAASGLGAAAAEAGAQAGLAQAQVGGTLAASQLAGAAEAQAAQTAGATAQLASQQRVGEAGLVAKGMGTREQIGARSEEAFTRQRAEEEAKTQAMTAGATNQLRNLQTQRGTSLDDIFSTFEQSNKELAFRKDAAALEQLGFTMAMSDKAYVNQLQTIGRERELNDNVRFAEEMNELVLGENLNAYMEQIGLDKAFNSAGRDWETQLTKLSIDEKMEFAKQVIKDNKKRGIFENITSMVGLGGQAVYDYNKSGTSADTSMGGGGGTSTGTRPVAN